MTSDPTSLDPAQIDAINAEASVLMKQGIHLMGEARREATLEALSCFERARELRRGLPFESTPALRYGLAACWLNRAEALMQLGDDDAIVAALQAYDEALELLRGLPIDEDARYRRRLVIALQNRGLVLQAQATVPASTIVAAFTEAIALLDDDAGARIDDRCYLQAATWMNLANALLLDAAGTAADAPAAARRALALVADTEEHDVEAADVGIKARHVLCRALAARLPPPAAGGTALDEVHDATDTVDDGLALARLWERQGVDRLRDVAHDLFLFGARVYERYQPQFLSEFLRDNLDPGQSSPAYVESAERRVRAAVPDSRAR